MARSLNAADMDEEARSRLDIPVADLDMSVRATNVCAFAGIGSLGELAQARSADLERVPNCGAKTLREFSDKLAEFDLSLDMRIAGWVAPPKRPRPAPGAPPPRPPRAVVSRKAACLEEELSDFLALIVEGRNHEIVSKYWGLSGKGRRTLESVGAEYGVTRERVRQIGQRVERRLKRYHVEMPWLAKAVDAVGDLCPATRQELARQLRERGISRSDFDVSALDHLCELVGRRFPFVARQYGAAELVVRRKDDDKVAEFFRLARKLTTSRGCANYEAVCEELGLGELERDRLQSAVAAGDCVWLDPHETWFMAKGTARNRLINLASKVFAVAPTVSVAELRRAVAKDPRLASAPPTAVMGRFLEAVGLASVVGDTATLRAGVDVSDAIATGGVEATLIDVLRDNPPVLGWDRFQDLSMARGVNPTSFGIYASKSPAISRLTRGVYALIGAPVPPGVVEEVAAEVAAARKPAEWGWLPRGTLWCAVPLNTTVLTAGRTSVPSFVYEFAEGEWPMRIAGRAVADTIKCGNGFMWGFRRTLLNAGAEAGDVFVVEFDAVARVATLFVGDEELIDEFEAGRAPSVDDGDDEDES